MKTLLILCALAIAIGFLLHPPLYLLIKKIKISKEARTLYYIIRRQSVFCLIFSFWTSYILNDLKGAQWDYVYSPRAIAHLLSILFGVIIVTIWNFTIKDKWKDELEDNFIEAASMLVVIWSIIMSIPITYYVFTWLAIPK